VDYTWWNFLQDLELGETGGAGDDVSDGYDLVQGVVSSTYPSLFRNAEPTNTFSLTQEFGTLHGVFVLKSLIDENQAFHSSATEDEQQPQRIASRRAFDVDSLSYQRSVVSRGLSVFWQAYEHLCENL
jgi:hypothetical protein